MYELPTNDLAFPVALHPENRGTVGLFPAAAENYCQSKGLTS
jgi:hypothetical protein